jgi:hypothetical protein
MLASFGDTPGILVGTQMLAKGHDLPQLALVAVVGVDEGLFSADFRAPEKLAQLLIQVAGRAGRASRPGEVLLQTHHPAHPLLSTLLAGGYHAFANAELEQREAAAFPPFAHLALLRAEAQQVEATTQFLQAARQAIADTQLGVELHGPLPAPMPRRAGYQRSQLLVSSSERPRLHAALEAAFPTIHALPLARRVRWSLDVDPVDLYRSVLSRHRRRPGQGRHAVQHQGDQQRRLQAHRHRQQQRRNRRDHAGKAVERPGPGHQRRRFARQPGQAQWKRQAHGEGQRRHAGQSGRGA